MDQVWWAARATGRVMRETSKAAFGQELRLALCLYIGRHEDGLFTLSSAAAALGVPSSALQAPLASLVTLGIVERAEGARSRREKLLRRRSNTLWSLAEELFRDEVDGQQVFDLTAIR